MAVNEAILRTLQHQAKINIKNYFHAILLDLYLASSAKAYDMDLFLPKTRSGLTW